MMKPQLPIPVLRNLKCEHCSKFVTCGPVHVTPDGSSLCGRCIRVPQNVYRNSVFEAVAEIYGYPCHYWSKHCNEPLLWNEALDHEEKCLFQSNCKVFCFRPATFFKPERKFKNNTEITLEHIPNNVLEKLKCLACENYLSNRPVFIVWDGKNICHRCVYSNGHPQDAYRNLSYETIASTIIFPCIYQSRGCAIKLEFGKKIWQHENECPYGQTSKRLSKRPSKIISKDGKEKERGVIETHSGHIWGTITPHSALFAPPKNRNDEGTIVTQELTKIIKKKNEDTQSVDSILSTNDSLGDDISRSTVDTISKNNISSNNISRSAMDNISNDVSRSSSRVLYFENRRISNRPILNEKNKLSSSGYFNNQMKSTGNGIRESFQNDIRHNPPLNNMPTYLPYVTPIRSESFRLGNPNLIDELKQRQHKKASFTTRENSLYERNTNLSDAV